MRRDKNIVLSLLQILESRQGGRALGLPELRDVYIENVGAFGDDEMGHLYLLIDSGILLKSPASEFLPASVKMTWAAYDLLDQLKKELVF